MSASWSTRVAVTALLLSLATFAGCGGSDSPGATGPFESDVPNATTTHGESAGASADSDGLDFMGVTNTFRGSTPGTLSGGTNDASREIVEADVVQLQGDNLYVLSREAGFAVVDVANPNALKILGRYRELPGTPFEMYLRGDVAILMFTGWSEYVRLEDGKFRSITTSKIVALDVADPAAISEIGSFDVPGSISDSRIVGDVLYVAGFEDGLCWNCEQNKQTTSVSSLSVADPRDMKKVDELRYTDTTGQNSWQRSITVTNQRMYVAGPEYGNGGPIGSTIQVIDISNASGDLVEGATLQARGQISSRWQMDEYDGVFRVVSQPGRWQTTDPPRLQTFKVISSKEFQPLAMLDITIPARETLQSARFDGPRGYLITAERKDPLFTLDLSDPTKPQQVGELEMPGFVYHMEPRGNRVLGLGFDQGNPEGSITVSLFDVSDIAKPKMLSRVNFGGDWGSLPEDQDRIHKVFRVLPEAGLLLVPFTGYERGDNYCGGNTGGVQLVDYANDRLTGRGSADSEFNVRRALLVDDYLFAVSDQRVESYSIADRSAPKKLPTQAVLSSHVQFAAQLQGDVVARLVSPNWSSHWTVELASKANAEDVDQRLGELSLDSVFDAPATDDKSCKPWWSIDSFHADGSLLYLVYTGWFETRTTSESESEIGVIVVDASDPAKPKIAGRTSWREPQTGGGWSTYYGNSYSGFGQATPFLWHGRVLAFFEQKYTSTNATTSKMSVRLHVVDLRDPEALKSTTLALGDNREYSRLIADGAQIVTSHYDYNPTGPIPTRIKYFADRIDISNVLAPKLVASVNIPGVVVHYDSASERAVTSLLHRVVVSGVKYYDCDSRFSYAEFVNTDSTNSDGPVEDWVGTCTGYTQSLQLVALRADGAVLEDTLALAENQQVNAFSAGRGRLFATLSTGNRSYYSRGESGGLGDCFDCVIGPEPEPVQLVVLSGFSSGEFTIGRLEYKSGDKDYWRGFWGATGVVADGTKALVLSDSEVAIVDASDGAAPAITRTLPLLGYAYVSSIDIQDGTALLAFGQQGLQLIDM